MIPEDVQMLQTMNEMYAFLAAATAALFYFICFLILCGIFSRLGQIRTNTKKMVDLFAASAQKTLPGRR